MINPIKLKPFTKFCVSLGMLPSSYKQSLTYEEQLIWFCDFLENKVIPAVNQNAEAVEEMQNLFNELQTYVNEYFSNIDVQEEINNKLDEMAESGELEEIIGVYLNANGILTFDTLNDMIISDKLVDGSVARTLGGLAFNDKNGHLYKIEHIISANPDGTNLINLGHDDLYARLILEPKIVNSLTDTDPTVNAPSVSAVNTALGSKANSSDVYTKTEIDNKYNTFQKAIINTQRETEDFIQNLKLTFRRIGNIVFVNGILNVLVKQGGSSGSLFSFSTDSEQTGYGLFTIPEFAKTTEEIPTGDNNIHLGSYVGLSPSTFKSGDDYILPSLHGQFRKSKTQQNTDRYMFIGAVRYDNTIIEPDTSFSCDFSFSYPCVSNT